MTVEQRLFRVRMSLASAMWAPVLATNVVAIALALTLPIVDERLEDGAGLPISESAAQQIFGALAAGMITFTGIIFSAVFVAAQIQTSAYSPRLAARLRRDPVIIAGLALPTATASYALFALAAIGRQNQRADDEFVPALTVVFGLILLVVTLGAFVALVQRAFEQTQIGGILRSLMRRAVAVIDDVHPTGSAGDDVAAAAPTDLPAVTISHRGRAGAIAAVDRQALLRLARQTGGFIEVVPRVGQFLAPGTTTLRVHGGDRPPEPRAAGRVLVLARQRTIDQDPAFALRILVDIAIRGLSPAINDPTTAVQALDRIEFLLVELQRRRTGPALVRNEYGEPCGFVPAPTLAEYMELGLTEIRQYGAGSVQIGRRLRAVYEHLLTTGDDDVRPQLELERRLLDETQARLFPDPDERAVVCSPDVMGLGGPPVHATARR